MSYVKQKGYFVYPLHLPQTHTNSHFYTPQKLAKKVLQAKLKQNDPSQQLRLHSLELESIGHSMPGQAKVLQQKEISDILKILDKPRDKSLFAIGIYTGMRVSEVISLEQDQVFTTDGGIRYIITVKRLKKKNTMYSDIPVHPKLRQILKEYKTKVKDNHWLFPSSESTSGHISRARAHQILASAFTTLNLQGAKTHSMRRSFLTHLSRAGIPLRTIQKISGHSNLGQLQAYLEVDEGDKHRAINLLKY